MQIICIWHVHWFDLGCDSHPSHCLFERGVDNFIAFQGSSSRTKAETESALKLITKARLGGLRSQPADISKPKSTNILLCECYPICWFNVHEQMQVLSNLDSFSLRYLSILFPFLNRWLHGEVTSNCKTIGNGLEDSVRRALWTKFLNSWAYLHLSICFGLLQWIHRICERFEI